MVNFFILAGLVGIVAIAYKFTVREVKNFNSTEEVDNQGSGGSSDTGTTDTVDATKSTDKFAI